MAARRGPACSSSSTRRTRCGEHHSTCSQAPPQSPPCSAATSSSQGGATPLHCAAYAHKRELIDELLRLGADPNIKDKVTRLACATPATAADARRMRSTRHQQAHQHSVQSAGPCCCLHSSLTHSGHLPALQLLIQPRRTTQSGHAALHLVVGADRVDPTATKHCIAALLQPKAGGPGAAVDELDAVRAVGMRCAVLWALLSPRSAAQRAVCCAVLCALSRARALQLAAQATRGLAAAACC